MNKVRIQDIDLEYKISRREIKYPRIEFKTGSLILILPKTYENPERLVKKHEKWIYRRASLIKNSIENSKQKKLNLNRNDIELKDHIHFLIKEFSKELSVEPNNIHFRLMKTKWGSCTVKCNLSFNLLLKYLPENLINYIVYHELVHLIERNHNNMFWYIISKKFADYKILEEDLMNYWFLIQSEVPNQT